jgi:hypothetical protein
MSDIHLDRRSLALAAAAAMAASTARAQTVTAPPLTYKFAMDIKVGPAQELGDFGGGRRRVIPILGGVITGPALTGEVLSGGADWQTLRPDGLTILKASYTLRAKDGATIGIVNTGVRKASAEVAQRLAAGQVVDPSQYYFRATPVFETGPGPHAWLVENVFICVGERLPDLVRLKVFQLG